MIRVFYGPVIVTEVKEYKMADKPNEVNISIKPAPNGGLDVKVSTDEDDREKKESTGSKKVRLFD